jgi:hypothetical protein
MRRLKFGTLFLFALLKGLIDGNASHKQFRFKMQKRKHGN